MPAAASRSRKPCVGLVAIDGVLVAADQLRRRLAVVQVGGGEDRGADDLRALVNRHVRLVAEVALAVLLRPAGLGVARADRAFFTEGGLTEACSSVASISVPWRTISRGHRAGG